MNTKQSFKKVLAIASCLSIFALSITSCNNANTEDAKEIAEEHNEAKYDNTSKEKDAQFLVNVAENNLSDIKLGAVAQKFGSVKIVKDLGKMMEDAHQLSMTELTALAQQKQMTIPIIPTASAEEMYNKLITKKGKAFDKEYCEMVIDGHKKTVGLFEAASTESKDAEIKNWALASLPNLRMHLDSAINIQKMCAKMK